MDRRSFIGALGAFAGAAVLDPERLLWVPGKKTIFVPPEKHVLRVGHQYIIKREAVFTDDPELWGKPDGSPLPPYDAISPDGTVLVSVFPYLLHSRFRERGERRRLRQFTVTAG